MASGVPADVLTEVKKFILIMISLLFVINKISCKEQETTLEPLSLSCFLFHFITY